MSLTVSVGLVLSGCCCAYDATVLRQPNGTVTVLGPDGEPVAGANVVLARFEEHPHFDDVADGYWESETDDRGEATFVHELGEESQMPLMMHGIGFHAWHVCVEKPGFATVLVKWLSEKVAPDGKTWDSYVDAGAEVEPLSVQLQHGASKPCEDVVARRLYDHKPVTVGGADAGVEQDAQSDKATADSGEP